ncbi:unnamed protein product [Rotaria magnacalcarata]|uniref:LIM zinc-binding domain-containing protein n=1 Tax=Rotaria magnacalcarata TaxID=392030 RepID=A0A816NR70_9BILA|nr:unnamed protein product [Rotaria magnacalcarata]CAF1574065.1 unnamed protein product [Rotaria magnacalcarata]CAF2038933.1 unnamed protein product [Rotaria magnacalcarata]CAF2072561.1 unnamed protein product [Rotaria magnacalcarata]CAF2101156.1 unnamed protein product [Rotaria magnacalcarata]
MNYAPINRGQDQSSSPLPAPPFHNSSTLYINQQRPVLHLPRPRFNVTVNGHLHSHHQQQNSNRTHDFSRITIRTPNIRSPRTRIPPFSTLMPTAHASENTSSAMNDVQRKLAALTLRLEKELETEATVGEYYGQCTKCGESVTGSSEACQAMGELYHNDCFKCAVCSRTLRGKAFYLIHDQVYCEEDYLFTGFQQTVEKCYMCDHLMTDKMLQALGNAYHPGCFRCSICNECLDGLPFTVDKERRLFCLYDYHNTYAPRCAKCAYPICPEENSDETTRVIAMNLNFHVECYRCEDCQCNLSDEQTIAALGGCCPLADGTLLCYRCHILRDDNDN